MANPGRPVQPDQADSLVAVCHCGRVRITLPSRPSFYKSCGCSACYKYGVYWSYFPQSEVAFAVDGVPQPRPDQVADPTQPIAGIDDYVRLDMGDDGKRTGHIAFQRCSHCGTVTNWRGRTAYYAGSPTALIAVNARLLPKETLEGIEHRISEGPPKRVYK